MSYFEDKKLLLKFENFCLDYLVRISRKIVSKKSIKYSQHSSFGQEKENIKIIFKNAKFKK
jgi:hypothetical protein